MPQIFKALASITAWTLFISAWIFVLTNTVKWILVGFQDVGWEGRAAYLALGVACFISSVVAMKLRKMLE